MLWISRDVSKLCAFLRTEKFNCTPQTVRGIHSSSERCQSAPLLHHPVLLCALPQSVHVRGCEPPRRHSGAAHRDASKNLARENNHRCVLLADDKKNTAHNVPHDQLRRLCCNELTPDRPNLGPFNTDFTSILWTHRFESPALRLTWGHKYQFRHSCVEEAAKHLLDQDLWGCPLRSDNHLPKRLKRLGCNLRCGQLSPLQLQQKILHLSGI